MSPRLGNQTGQSVSRAIGVDAFQAIAQEPDEPAFEVDSLDTVEIVLRLVMARQHLGGDGFDLGGGLPAVRLPADRLQRMLQLPGMVLGDDDMAFLVPLDVGFQRIPDQPHIAFRALWPPPLWQDHLGLYADSGLYDAAAAILFAIADAAYELHLRRARMPATGCFHLWAARHQLRFDLVQRAAAD